MHAREDSTPGGEAMSLPIDAAPPEPAVEVRMRSDGASPYAAVVILRGEHDLASRDALTSALEPIWGNVLVDLGECAFIDSTVIGVLLSRAEQLRREGHRLDLVAPPGNETITRVLEITGIGGLLTVYAARP